MSQAPCIDFQDILPIDWQSSLNLISDEEDLKAIFKIYIAELATFETQLKSAKISLDITKTKQICHKLLGASNYCSSPRIRKVIELIQRDISRSNMEDLIDLLLLELNEVRRFYAQNHAD